MLHDVGAWPDALVLGISDPEDSYLATKLRYRVFPQGIPGNLPLIVYSGMVVVERNPSEMATASDSPSNILQRAKDLTEPALSVSDLASSEKVLSYIPRDVNEPAVSTSDITSYQLRRFQQVTETVISVSDAIEQILQRACEISETPISISDLADVEKFVAYITRDISETLGLVVDLTIALRLEGWETAIFQDESETTVIGSQTLSIVIETQAETEVQGVVE